jgi:hypothetical protein
MEFIVYQIQCCRQGTNHLRFGQGCVYRS